MVNLENILPNFNIYVNIIKYVDDNKININELGLI